MPTRTFHYRKSILRLAVTPFNISVPQEPAAPPAPCGALAVLASRASIHFFLINSALTNLILFTFFLASYALPIGGLFNS